MIRIVKTEKKFEAFVGDKRIYLATIGTGWGECTRDYAEMELGHLIALWSEDAVRETHTPAHLQA